MQFQLKSPFKATGDQPRAIEDLYLGIQHDVQHQVLLGVTGSGKTFTMANLIARLQRPTLIISHNKTLAAQLYQEFRDFFPNNAVSYFVSYYDYYQPEAYIPRTDTYIEKETDINEEIDKLRLAATTNLLTRKDTIIVASVSCIYNIGSPKEYGNFILDLRVKMPISRDAILGRLTELQYERADYGFHRGSFRVHGEIIDVFLAYEDYAIRIEQDGRQISRLRIMNPLDGSFGDDLKGYVIYPAKHYMTDPHRFSDVFPAIMDDMTTQVRQFTANNKLLEANRIEKRVTFDLEMIREIGYVNGIENYSRYFDNRQPGDPPYTLLDYYNDPYQNNWLLFIDESHITVPQIRGMYNGDRSRKQVLVDYGFRLPAAMDNRPLTFPEFMRRVPQTIYVSATPNEWEISLAKESAIQHKKESYSSSGIVEQLIRPTGLVDPEVVVRPSEHQIPDLVMEILKRKKAGERVLITTLTKRMAEDLAEALGSEDYMQKLLKKQGVKEQFELPSVHYLHADVHTLDRSDILDDLRRGTYDVLVGINLLREGLDLPEVSLVAIIDADKEGFLRSATSLIQTMGRAARHEKGLVILYADTITGSMKRAMEEVNRRRTIQIAYNATHKITPTSIHKKIKDKLIERDQTDEKYRQKDHPLMIMDQLPDELLPDQKKSVANELRKAMRRAATELNFELAAQLRDRLRELET